MATVTDRPIEVRALEPPHRARGRHRDSFEPPRTGGLPPADAGGPHDLRTQGVAFVFNTPNDKSRPGYLKMGWTTVGRLGTSLRFASPTSVARLARARVPADLWSAPSAGGRPGPEVLGDPGLAASLRSVGEVSRLRAHRTPEYLRWRNGFPQLAYRAVTLRGDVREGLAIFRLRRRGPAVECGLGDLLAPVRRRGARRALVRSVGGQCGATT
jgi:hypothetical protein